MNSTQKWVKVTIDNLVSIPNKISFDEFMNFMRQWDLGNYGELRMGQAFINNVMPDLYDTELFYMHGYTECRNNIFSKYVCIATMNKV